jgi:hypothetical protein
MLMDGWYSYASKVGLRYILSSQTPATGLDRPFFPVAGNVFWPIHQTHGKYLCLEWLLRKPVLIYVDVVT